MCSLKEVDFVVNVQRHNCLFPVFRSPIGELVPAWLAFASLRRNARHFDFKQLLNCILNVSLGCQGIYLERVLVEFGRLVHRLLSDRWLDDDLVGLKNQLRWQCRLAISLCYYFTHDSLDLCLRFGRTGGFFQLIHCLFGHDHAMRLQDSQCIQVAYREDFDTLNVACTLVNHR
ncbi:MAG: hypothetical protein ACI814_000729 [Mariniblastus sp.]